MSIDTNAQLPNKPTGFAGGLLWGLGELLLICTVSLLSRQEKGGV